MVKKIFYCLAVLSCLLFFSCNKNKNIDMASDDCMKIAPDLEWAVIVVPYAAFRTDYSYTSEVCANARKGEIFKVTGKQSVLDETDGNKDALDKTIWYHFEQGWLDESLVTIYDTRLKAESAVRKM